MEGMRAVVTGGCGFVGLRLCEMLLERGAAHVVAFDLKAPPKGRVAKDSKIEFVLGDIRDADRVQAVIAGADVVFHVAAVVGTFHPKQLYREVNYDGTLNVLAACKKHKVRRLVYSGTPSTRMHGRDISGLREEDLDYPEQFMAEYAATKALAEKAVFAAVSEDLLATSVMPHQVYGPWDSLFLPQLMYVAKQGKLRVFGSGENEISICFNDNYCHGLILAAEKLYRGSPVVGNWYIITDGGKVKLWDLLEEASNYLGYGSITAKTRVPYWLMMFVASLTECFSKLTGKTMRVSRFTVKMLMIDRWFRIDNAESDLGYAPLVPTKEAWSMTLAWHKEHEDYLIQSATSGLAQRGSNATKADKTA